MLRYDLYNMFDIKLMLQEKIKYGDLSIHFLKQIKVLMLGRVVLGIVICQMHGMEIVV